MQAQTIAPSRAKRLIFSLIAVLLVLGVAEVICRFYFAALIGRSVLFYGTPFERDAVVAGEKSPLLGRLKQRRMRGVGDRNNTARHADNRLANYSKYHPNQDRSTYDADTGEVYRVTINSRGFRGPEFADEKAPGVTRVVTLGASSTFGYHARDDLTYPAQLQRLLDAACPGRKFEVINLGIPHLTSTQILALFAAEGLRLRPDVVTFYEGFNDANELDEDDGEGAKAERPKSAWRQVRKRVSRWARERLLLVAFVDALKTNWTNRYSPEQIAAQAEHNRRGLLDNLSQLVRLSEEEGFIPIVATQQARSLLIPREEIRGVTFEQELGVVSATLKRQGWVGRKEAAFLVYAEVLPAQRAWARRNEVTLVDLHQALDARRDILVSWVHLSHEGNRMVAESLAAAIVEKTCTRPAHGVLSAAHE